MRRCPNHPIVFSAAGRRGTILIEVMVATIIFAIVTASIAWYFIFHLGTMRGGRAQLKLQRTGSLVMEELAQAIRSGRTTNLEQEGVPYTDIMITYPDSSTRCFTFESNDILEGPDYDPINLTPLEALDDSLAVASDARLHRIVCDSLQFVRQGDTVKIRFSLTHDLNNGDAGDDLTINLGSTIKLRG